MVGLWFGDERGYNATNASDEGSISDEVHLAKIIRDILDDADAGDGEVMRCLYAKMVARGIPVDWEDLL